MDHRQREWQGYLLCEAALAAAEADCGLVPAAAAAAIVERASLEQIDLAALDAELRRSRHAMMPIVRVLAQACPAEAAGWVHWGATTQNIRQSADMLQLRAFQRWLCAAWAGILRRLAALADEHRATLCAGRSHGQHAVPTTAGMLFASWASAGEELGGQLLDDGAAALRAQLGGAVGTLAAFGEQGLAVMARFAAQLDLPPEPMPDRCLHLAIDRYGLGLGQLGMLGEQIATSLMLGMRSEQGEFAEGLDAGVVSSSTMPQKVNPKDCQAVIQLGRRLAHNAAAHLAHPAPWESGDRAVRSMVYSTLEQSRELCLPLLAALRRLLERLVLRPEAMRRNLESGGLWLMSERVMLALAERLGRQEAHERMRRLAALQQDCSLPEALRREFGDELDAATIEELCAPEGYLGASGQLIDTCLERVAVRVAALEAWATRPIDPPHPLLGARLRAYTAAIEAELATAVPAEQQD